jgi:hypothetical protein
VHPRVRGGPHNPPGFIGSEPFCTVPHGGKAYRRDMPEYRIYTMTDANKIAGPSQDVICENDQEAVHRTKQWLNGHDLEVRQGARVVIRLKSKT